jgi:uncharacterized membrane protein HdeD (DUF308 family)
MGGETRTEAELDRAKSIDKLVMARPWWEMVLRGILLLVLGSIAIAYPDITIEIIILLFGALILVEGIFLVIGSIAVKAEDPMWVVLLIGGIVSIALGAIILAYPDLTERVVLFLIGAWAFIVGLINLMWALKVRKNEEVTGKGVHALFGIIGIGFGIIAIAWPEETAVTLVVIIGIFVALLGILMVIAGLMARKEQQIE